MQHKYESPADVQRCFQSHCATLWPAALGSLSLRRSRCICKTCSACASGEKHPSWVLSGHLQGKRFSLYVPEALVPKVQRCLENGPPSRNCSLCLGPALRSGFETKSDAPLILSGRSLSPMSRTTVPRVSFADWGLMHQRSTLDPLRAANSDLLDQEQDLIERVRLDLERGLQRPGSLPLSVS